MKLPVKILLILFAFQASYAGNSGAGSYLVNQEIQYRNLNAREVTLVWGINNWNTQDKRLWPKGTVHKGGLLYTPMVVENGVFTTQLPMRPNTLIDYVFWISKGPRDVVCDIWDANQAPQKDYHTLAANDNRVLIDSKQEVIPKQELSLLNYSNNLFSIFLLLGILAFALRRHAFREIPIRPGPFKIIIYSALTLLAMLILARASVALPGWKLYYHPIEYIPRLLWLSFYDYLFVTFLALFFIGVLFILRKYPRARNLAAGIFILTILISAVAGILNIRVVEMLGKPFNYRWFYYSGFLKSSDAKAALSSNMPPAYIFDIILVVLAGIFACIFFIYIFEILLQKIKMKRALLVSFLLLNVTYILVAGAAIKKNNTDYDKLANPVTAFAESLNPFSPTPQLYTMEVPDSLKEQFISKSKTTLLSEIGPEKKIRNVVILVLESTPAEYLQPYSKEYAITPVLEKQLPHAIVFNNIYAHAPATNKSMVCLLGSLYPWLSHNSITKEYPAIDIKTISSELKAKGYRTSFFNSGDSRFQKANVFLSHRGFDVAKDCKTLSCKTKFEEKKEGWEDLDGTDDECAGDAMLNWIGEEDGKPFFTMLWTYQTHYPYYCCGPVKNYGPGDTVLNRYLNAVSHSDAVLGKIIDELKNKGLDESTLVVVIGDHGEAFGRHDQTTHASKLYEENVHIPCVFINPGLAAQTNNMIGGLVDVAPTIMSVLGLPSPQQWQGVDLFSTVGKNKTFFFCPWSDYLFGYRQGNKKYIYNATKNRTEVYDLEKDPQEKNDLAASSDIARCHLELAAWVQYQDKFMTALLEKKKR